MEMDWSMENLLVNGFDEIVERTEFSELATNDHHDAMVQRCERVINRLLEAAKQKYQFKSPFSIHYVEKLSDQAESTLADVTDFDMEIVLCITNKDNISDILSVFYKTLLKISIHLEINPLSINIITCGGNNDAIRFNLMDVNNVDNGFKVNLRMAPAEVSFSSTH